MDMMITLFLCGDVMLGRGIDQIMQHSVNPILHESYVRNARRYVELAEEAFGKIPGTVAPEYVWGDALDILAQFDPDVRVINLETAVTTSDEYDRNKGIHYRMHPENINVLNVAGIDLCVLANNHVLDWGTAGLRETLNTLKAAGIGAAGAGVDDDEAEKPAIIDVQGAGRIIVYSFAMPNSGVPRDWAARSGQPGVNYLPDLSDQSVDRVAGLIEETADENDIIIFSVHWGGNWGYEIPEEQIRFAHQLIDKAGVDIVHGHSSHHVKGIEIHNGRLIFYGCGDFLNDYEGISGHERYRPDLSIMYFPTIDLETGELSALRMRPMQIRNFKLNNVSTEDALWLAETLNRESKGFGIEITLDDESGELVAKVNKQAP